MSFHKRKGVRREVESAGASPHQGVRKPRRFVRMFKAEFAVAVMTGRKRQTVRPVPKVLPQAGDIIDCRQWSGMPYRSPHRYLGEGIVQRVRAVWIEDNSVTVWADPKVLLLLPEDWHDAGRGASAEAVGEFADHFARKDGFKDFEGMVQWFERQHGLPFAGCLIEWRPGFEQEGAEGAEPQREERLDTLKGGHRTGGGPHA